MISIFFKNAKPQKICLHLLLPMLSASAAHESLKEGTTEPQFLREDFYRASLSKASNVQSKIKATLVRHSMDKFPVPAMSATS